MGTRRSARGARLSGRATPLLLGRALRRPGGRFAALEPSRPALTVFHLWANVRDQGSLKCEVLGVRRVVPGRPTET